MTGPTAARIISFLLLASCSFYFAAAQAPVYTPAAAPGPGDGAVEDCFTVLLNISDCLSYVEEGSKVTVPDKPCCPELSNLIGSSPSCLCQLLSDPDKVGLSIDLKKAVQLPSVCKLDAPVNLCSVLGYPVAGVGVPSPSILPPGVHPPDSGLTPKSSASRNGWMPSSVSHSLVLLLLASSTINLSSHLPLFL